MGGLPQATSAFYSVKLCSVHSYYVSVNSKPEHPSRDSHIAVAPGVGFLLFFLTRGSARGVLNQNKNSIILKKARFLHCHLNKLKSSSSFHMVYIC